MATFRDASTYNPKDGLPGVYIERCEELKAEPPADWDGVWVMKEK